MRIINKNNTLYVKKIKYLTINKIYLQHYVYFLIYVYFCIFIFNILLCIMYRMLCYNYFSKSSVFFICWQKWKFSIFVLVIWKNVLFCLVDYSGTQKIKTYV